MAGQYKGGVNIALKVPDHQFEETVRFYRDVIGLELLPGEDDSVSFRFGSNRLWIDPMPTLSKAEVWLELATGDTAAAARHLADHQVPRRDGVERLPESVDGFWICDPANNILLIHRTGT